jgi:predicted DNA-binding antitoxin AbrB/MazE fold protein
MRTNTARRNDKKRRKTMAGTIRARMKGGMLEPLETLDLPEGKEVTVTILDVPSARDVDAFRRSAGGWKGTIDAEELIKNIYADRMISTRSEPRL